MQAILEEERSLSEWVEEDDIILVDRGYRDVLPMLDDLEITSKMPAVLQQGQRQLTTEDANNTRLITVTRWMVEARNGHIRSIFKFFKNVFNIQNAEHIGDYYRIAGAIINKYRPPLQMRNATVEIARGMRERVRLPNVVQARNDVENLLRRRAHWQRLIHQVPEFPRLTIEYLQAYTYGVYQVSLAPSYIQDTISRERDHELQIDQLFNESNLIRIGIYSRFRRAIEHQILISFIDDDLEEEEEPINGNYCTCQTGARTLGTCSHVASILWYLGYARHQPGVKWPQTNLLNSTLDAANRQQEVVNPF